ncbi:transposase [Ruegeria sp. HKCCD6157]|nr:transposase [Ruegeria sp. HKCCD6157]
MTDEQVARLAPFLAESLGTPRVDDKRVLSGIISINRNCSRWRDVPEKYRAHNSLYSRRKRWCEKGIFAGMLAGLVVGQGEKKTVMIPIVTSLACHSVGQ